MFDRQFQKLWSADNVEIHLDQRMKLTEVDVESGAAGDCSVCLDPLLVGAEMRALPCGHTYHRKCVDKWLIRRRKCPLCKLDILQHFKTQIGDSSESES